MVERDIQIALRELDSSSKKHALEIEIKRGMRINWDPSSQLFCSLVYASDFVSIAWLRNSAKKRVD